MITIAALLLVSAFVCTIASAIGKCPLWIPVLLVIIWGLLTVIPLR